MVQEPLAVAPTDLDVEHNTIREPLLPIDVWELADTHFAFDSSVLLPTMTDDLATLIAKVREKPNAPLSVFGHADTTGNDEYNKVLAGRRAMALFAMLTRRVDLFEFLFSNPHGGDDWRRENDFALSLMRQVTQQPVSTPRAALFELFMTALSSDPRGKSFGLPKSAFLGKGADPKGRMDFQGCGEFNPLVMHSAAEARDFRDIARKKDRDEAGEPNRRVIVFFFPPGTTITPNKWPCPRALENSAACRRRFWSDAAARRSFQPNRRIAPFDDDTFACRFYDRLQGGLVREFGPPQGDEPTIVPSSVVLVPAQAPSIVPASVDVKVNAAQPFIVPASVAVSRAPSPTIVPGTVNVRRRGR